MSWEVPSMKSRTSFYNKGFGLNLLRRFWPLWALWLAVLLLAAPLSVAGVSSADYYLGVDFLNSFHHAVLESGRNCAYFAIVAGALMAMAMLSYLYSPRICGMVNSLPMTRTEAYATAALTGLLPMLAADVIVWLSLLAVMDGVPGADKTYAMKWLLMVVFANAGFYGFGLFCGVLTGNVLVLPAVYVVLGCTAYVAESAVRALLGQIVYGYTYTDYRFGFLSPIPYVLDKLSIIRPTYPAGGLEQEAAALPAQYQVEGLGYLAAFCAAGLVLAVLAALILKKRHMETAGETVAVPILRPLFRICMAVGCGIVFACVLCEWFVGMLFHGRALAFAAMVLLVIGAALGFFAAEMLMKKTLRVFDHGWKQLGIIAACLVVFALLAEFDVAGYETYVPNPDEVASVELPNGIGALRDPESVAAYCAFHRGLIAHKEENESAGGRRGWVLPLRYELNDGRTVTRLYNVINDERSQADPDSDLRHYETLSNLPECIDRRVMKNRTLTEADFLNAYVQVQLYDEMRGGWRGQELNLTREQAIDLYRTAILPDAASGNIGRFFVYGTPDRDALMSNVNITMELTPDPDTEMVERDAGTYYYADRSWLDLNVLMSSENTRRWLEENLGVTAENQHTLEAAIPARVYA